MVRELELEEPDIAERDLAAAVDRLKIQDIIKGLEQYPSTDLLTYAITGERVGVDYIVDCLPAS